jgi:hypothetical protein
MVFNGDAEARIVEPKVIARYKDSDIVPVTAMKLGHHGSAASTSDDYVDMMKPDIIFASGDKRWGHPYCNAIDRGQAYVTQGNGVWYACSASGADNDYDNTNTTDNICMNLWYVVTNPKGVTKKNLAGQNKKEPFGTYTGVQWRMEFNPGSDPYLAWASESEWPAP